MVVYMIFMIILVDLSKIDTNFVQGYSLLFYIFCTVFTMLHHFVVLPCLCPEQLSLRQAINIYNVIRSSPEVPLVDEYTPPG